MINVVGTLGGTFDVNHLLDDLVPLGFKILRVRTRTRGFTAQAPSEEAINTANKLPFIKVYVSEKPLHFP
jgi:hypothetical protein